ncbi:MAG: hypothetical protein FWE98_08780 [Oscillospiraceae bacterium]|nr:hypothetical protein [Oscillospiraceae bacterium]
MISVKNYNSTVDGVVLTHSDMLLENHARRVVVRFERPNEHGFDFAEGLLPENIITKSYGFSEDELFELREYLRCNAPLIWEFSQEDGGYYAKSAA